MECHKVLIAAHLFGHLKLVGFHLVFVTGLSPEFLAKSTEVSKKAQVYSVQKETTG